MYTGVRLALLSLNWEDSRREKGELPEVRSQRSGIRRQKSGIVG
jgi:hypothetical protein